MAAGPSPFSLDEKGPKNQVSREASMPHGPLPGIADKTTGCNYFTPVVAQGQRFSKNLLCPYHAQAIRFARSHPKLIC
jgi:hypothetical protein